MVSPLSQPLYDGRTPIELKSPFCISVTVLSSQRIDSTLVTLFFTFAQSLTPVLIRERTESMCFFERKPPSCHTFGSIVTLGTPQNLCSLLCTSGLYFSSLFSFCSADASRC